MHKKIIDSAIGSSQKRNCCFVAGTLVHTKEGLVPIEEIQEGDWVLSKPESGEGEATYKRVLTATVSESAVMYVEFSRWGHRNTDFVLVSPFHLFWVVAEYTPWMRDGNPEWEPDWVKARHLCPGRMLATSDGGRVEVLTVKTVYGMFEPGKGWVEVKSTHDEIPPLGWVIDFNGEYPSIESNPELRPLVKNDEMDDSEYCEHWEDHLTFEPILSMGGDVSYLMLSCRVYNLEVEDYSTYFVHKEGIWVHTRAEGDILLGQLPGFPPNIRV